MKRVIGALILALIAVAACAFTLFYIENTSNTALSYVLEMQTQIEKNNYKNSAENAQNLENFWNEKNDLLATFVHHEMLEEIDESVRSINVMLKNFDENEKTNLQVRCKKAHTLLDDFKNADMPTIITILYKIKAARGLLEQLSNPSINTLKLFLQL